MQPRLLTSPGGLLLPYFCTAQLLCPVLIWAYLGKGNRNKKLPAIVFLLRHACRNWRSAILPFLAWCFGGNLWNNGYACGFKARHDCLGVLCSDANDCSNLCLGSN